MADVRARTYKEFAERAECDYTTVSRLLSGDRSPSTRLLRNICLAFKLDEGVALRKLGEDQERDDGRTTTFGNWLRDVTMADAVSERA